MRPFNPNAYGNPKIQSRSAAVSTSQLQAPLEQDGDDGHNMYLTPDMLDASAQDHNQKPSAVAVQPNGAACMVSPAAGDLSRFPKSVGPHKRAVLGGIIRGINRHKATYATVPENKSLRRGEPDVQSLSNVHTPASQLPCTTNNTSEPQANGKSVHTSNIAQNHTESTSKMPHSNLAATRSQPIIPLDFQNGEQLSPEDMLKRARERAVKDIQLRIRARDKNSTTALQVLDLARKPVSKKESYVVSSASIPRVSGSRQDPGHARTTSTLAQATVTDAKRLSAPTSQHTDQVEIPVPEPPAPISTGQSRTTEKNVNSPSERPQNWTSANRPRDLEFEAIPANLEGGSNRWGSSIPSDASQASNDSTRPLHVGKLLTKRVSEPIPAHARWNPGWQPPPVDWHERPRFSNDSPEFRDDLVRWKHDVYTMTMRDGGLITAPIPAYVLEDTRLIPDGIFLVMTDYTIHSRNALFYGYENPEEVTKYAQPVKQSDFEDWGKLDLSRAENVSIQQETAEKLVSNWIQHTEERRRNIAVQIQQDKQALKALDDYEPAPNPNRPLLDIYLRPAVETDVQQMTEIYNWYVTNSCRTAEMFPIGESEIEARLNESETNKLPLLVAVRVDSNNTTVPYDSDLGGRIPKGRSYQNNRTEFPHAAMTGKEEVVGWASAQDYTAFDFVEHISAELEIFVEPSCRQMGIGRCLLDQLLDACDRGYLKQGGYSFHCEQEVRHLYSSGGGRNLHKLMFLLRKWKHPKDSQVRATKRARPDITGQKKPEDREDDYDAWLKAWFESRGFEVEGLLKGVGAKNGRFIDIVLLARETGWCPAEGQIPDPLPDL